MKEVRTWAELENYFKSATAESTLQAIGLDKSAIKDVLMNDVAPEMEDILIRHIESDIYGAYTPHEFRWSWNYTPPGFVRSRGDSSSYIKYQRRNSLLDKGKMVRKMIDDNTVFVTQDAEPNESILGWTWVPNGDGAFLQMLGTHVGRLWYGGFARDAIGPAQKEIDESQEVMSALERGIKRHTK